MSGVVVDTSVWIDFFAGRSCAFLEEVLPQGLVVLPPLVVEILAIVDKEHAAEWLARAGEFS